MPRGRKIRGTPGPGARGTAGRSTRPRDIGFAVASCAALAVYNNVINRHPWHHQRYVTLNACATGAALSAAAASGLTAADMGFGREEWAPGRLGAWAAATVAAGWLVIAAVPATRPVLGDKRVTSIKGRDVAYQAVVRIPIGTVLWEEAAFRGVLQAALRRVMPETATIVVTSTVFGIWHIRPTLQALRVNGLASDRGEAVARVAAGVAATAAGGALLSWLRARSGSLTAPVLLHLATNSGGMVAAWAVASLDRAQDE
jgi:membrane protease YdiL (CAAX protease family)